MARLVSYHNISPTFSFSLSFLFFQCQPDDGNISWTFNFDEDPYGEIDIIEGVMTQPDNIVSLHTCGPCQFDFSSSSGRDARPDCDLGGVEGGCSDDVATNLYAFILPPSVSTVRKTVQYHSTDL